MMRRSLCRHAPNGVAANLFDGSSSSADTTLNAMFAAWTKAAAAEKAAGVAHVAVGLCLAQPSQEPLRKACAALRLPCLAWNGELASVADVAVAAQHTLALDARVASTSITTNTKTLAHYYLSRTVVPEAEKPFSMVDYANQTWTQELLLKDLQPISAERQLQFQQLIDYWALVSHQSITPDLAARLLRRFQSLEAVERFCANASAEEKASLHNVMEAASSLLADRARYVPDLLRGANALPINFAETMFNGAPLDVSTEAIKYVASLGIALDEQAVDRTRELLRSLSAVPALMPTVSSKAVAISTTSEAAPPSIESVFSDAELLEVLRALMPDKISTPAPAPPLAEATQEPSMEVSSKELSAMPVAAVEPTGDAYLDYLMEEAKYLNEGYDPEQPQVARALPPGLFAALAAGGSPAEVLQGLLDAACDKVATMSPSQLGLTEERFIALYEMLDRSAVLTIDFSAAADRFTEVDLGFTGSEMLAQRLIASSLPAGQRRGALSDYRRRIASNSGVRVSTYEPYQVELLTQLVIPSARRPAHQGFTPNLQVAIRDVMEKGQPCGSPNRHGKSATPRLVLLHVDGADSLYLQMARANPRQSRIALAKSFASTLLAVFEAKHNLLWDGMILVPIISGLSTDYCTELLRLQSSHYAFAAVVQQLNAQDPRPKAPSRTLAETRERVEILTDAQGEPLAVDSAGLEVVRSQPVGGPMAATFASVASYFGKDVAGSFAAQVADMIMNPADAKPLPQGLVQTEVERPSQPLVAGPTVEAPTAAVPEPQPQAVMSEGRAETKYRVGYSSSAALAAAAAEQRSVKPTAADLLREENARIADHVAAIGKTFVDNGALAATPSELLTSILAVPSSDLNPEVARRAAHLDV